MGAGHLGRYRRGAGADAARLEENRRTTIRAARLQIEEKTMEEKVEQALMDELTRQSAESELKVRRESEGRVFIEGHVDIVALTTAVVGSVAGGP